VSQDVPLSYGVSPSSLSDAAAGKMNDMLAGKPFRGGVCRLLRRSLDSAGTDDIVFARDCANNVVHGTLRLMSSFCWLWMRLPVPSELCYRRCASVRRCRGLSPADRRTVASYSFPLVLLVCWMRHRVLHAEGRAQRHSGRNGRVRWAMSDESMEKSLVTMPARAGCCRCASPRQCLLSR
jgi:hypothetical protein